jgi:hypothetical protein
LEINKDDIKKEGFFQEVSETSGEAKLSDMVLKITMNTNCLCLSILIKKKSVFRQYSCFLSLLFGGGGGGRSKGRTIVSELGLAKFRLGVRHTPQRN